MHMRRVLILVAMVVLLTGVVVAITPPARRQVDSSPGPPPASPDRRSEARDVSLRYPPPEKPPVVSLVPGDHTVVQVTTTTAGEAGVMGLTDTAEPGTPATFDLLVPGPASYAVTFTPGFGRPSRIGTLAVKP
jgi:hypothetical protein